MITNIQNSKAALARTTSLIREYLHPAASDDVIVGTLLKNTVVLRAQREDLRIPATQTFLVTTALLAARSGAQVYLDFDDVPISGPQPPLRGDRLRTALLKTLGDIIPGITSPSHFPERSDCEIVLGAAEPRAEAALTIRAAVLEWSGSVSVEDAGTITDCVSPFGALAASGIAATEAFKVAVRNLRPYALDLQSFDETFRSIRCASIAVAPVGTPDLPVGLDLGLVDFVSAGAINQSAIYALARIAGIHARVRVTEPETADISNVNRYALMRASDSGYLKAEILENLSHDETLAGITIEAVIKRFVSAEHTFNAPLRDKVLVGVDDIPTRWNVQRSNPSWLAIGATSHFQAMASLHLQGSGGCAACAHPKDDPGTAIIPSAAFVSHWAGTWIAALLARNAAGFNIACGEHLTYLAPLRADGRYAKWQSPIHVHPHCPIGHSN